MLSHVRHVVRYALAGGFTTALYVALTLLLSGPLRVPIQIAIALSFATVLGTHFLLQRHFVFGHVGEFHLSAGTQVRRYLIVGAVQYAVTAASLAVLPGWLDLSEPVVYADRHPRGHRGDLPDYARASVSPQPLTRGREGHGRHAEPHVSGGAQGHPVRALVVGGGLLVGHVAAALTDRTSRSPS